MYLKQTPRCVRYNLKYPRAAHWAPQQMASCYRFHIGLQQAIFNKPGNVRVALCDSGWGPHRALLVSLGKQLGTSILKSARWLPTQNLWESVVSKQPQRPEMGCFKFTPRGRKKVPVAALFFSKVTYPKMMPVSVDATSSLKHIDSNQPRLTFETGPWWTHAESFADLTGLAKTAASNVWLCQEGIKCQLWWSKLWICPTRMKREQMLLDPNLLRLIENCACRKRHSWRPIHDLQIALKGEMDFTQRVGGVFKFQKDGSSYINGDTNKK